jgi:hypothetical protein
MTYTERKPELSERGIYKPKEHSNCRLVIGLKNRIPLFAYATDLGNWGEVTTYAILEREGIKAFLKETHLS